MPIPPEVEPDTQDESFWWIEGRVRGVTLGTTIRSEDYARIRLAGDNDYLLDFDEPQAWARLRGRDIRAMFTDQTGSDGQSYRCVRYVEVV